MIARSRRARARRGRGQVGRAELDELSETVVQTALEAYHAAVQEKQEADQRAKRPLSGMRCAPSAPPLRPPSPAARRSVRFRTFSSLRAP